MRARVGPSVYQVLGAERAKDAAEEWVEANAEKLGRAQAKVRHYSAKLAKRMVARKARRGLARAIAKQSSLSTSVNQGMRTLKAAKAAEYTIPVVFAAWDVWNALSEYREQAAAAE